MINKISNDTKPQCSIIIRCYNEDQHIGRLLSGIMQQSIKNIEIILVDSGSTDATLPIASRFPTKIVYISPEEFSFGRALNRGIHAASGEFIVMASAHVYPTYNDWLEHLLKPFTNPKVALVYGKQRGNEDTKFSEHQIFAKWFPDQPTSFQDHPFCNNANAAIRCEFWERLPYNEELTGLEDLDWAKRAMSSGYHIVYAPEAEIIHVHNETPWDIYNRYRREAIAFKHIFPHEKFHLYDFIRMFTGNVISDYYHAWHEGVLSENLLNNPVFRFMQFWGTYKGFSQSHPVTTRLKQTFYYPHKRSRPVNNAAEKEQRHRIDYTGLNKEDLIEKDH